MAARLAVAAMAACMATGCGSTKGSSAHAELAREQERCAGYWRRSGDPDRATEMDRRAMETRRAGDSIEVDPWADFIFWMLTTALLGPSPPQPVKQAPHPSDPRGCE